MWNRAENCDGLQIDYRLKLLKLCQNIDNCMFFSGIGNSRVEQDPAIKYHLLTKYAYHGKNGILNQWIRAFRDVVPFEMP